MDFITDAKSGTILNKQIYSLNYGFRKEARNILLSLTMNVRRAP